MPLSQQTSLQDYFSDAVKTVHLVVPTSEKYIPAVEKGRPSWSIPRGVEQRNAGLNWLRKHFNCNGVFYFGDDDNKYDLRLFDEVSKWVMQIATMMCALSLFKKVLTTNCI